MNRRLFLKMMVGTSVATFLPNITNAHMYAVAESENQLTSLQKVSYRRLLIHIQDAIYDAYEDREDFLNNEVSRLVHKKAILDRLSYLIRKGIIRDLRVVVDEKSEELETDVWFRYELLKNPVHMNCKLKPYGLEMAA